jgi:hypothetical protein
MSRRIITTAFQANGGGILDGYFDRILKYIPADIVGAWIAVTGIVKGATGISTQTVLWICFSFGVVLTPFWILQQTHIKDTPPAYLQAAVSTAAFCVWVFAVGEPFSGLGFYNPVYGSLVLIAFSLLSGRIVPDA